MTNFFEKIMRRWFSVASRRSAHLRFQRLRLSVRGRISCRRKPPVKINLFFISSYLYVEKMDIPGNGNVHLKYYNYVYLYSGDYHYLIYLLL